MLREAKQPEVKDYIKFKNKCPLISMLIIEINYTVCPTRYRTRHSFNNSNANKDTATKQTHTTDTFLFISHTTNVLLFKFRCNIFIGVRIIKEMWGG
jgi:hypothetical protein